MNSIFVEIVNGLDVPITLEFLRVPAVTFVDLGKDLSLPRVVLARQQERVQVPTVASPMPDAVFGGAPMPDFPPRYEYKVHGVTWHREGDESPQPGPMVF